MKEGIVVKPLIEYEHKKVRIVTNYGKVYECYVGDYCYPQYNEDGIESIIIDIEGDKTPYEISGKDIISIEEI